MNLKQLEYFVRVAELGSFSKAAMILNIAQPALSRQVRLLETGLHANLLTRTGRDLGQLLPLLDRIDRESLAAQRRVTVPFLRKALGLE